MTDRVPRGPRGAALVACLWLFFAACSPSTTAQAPPTASGSGTASATPVASQALELCFRPIPADWSAAISQKAATLSNTMFSPAAMDDSGGVVYGYYRSASQQGVASVDLRTGKMTVVSSMTATESGVMWMSYNDGWLAWAQGESTELIGAWSIQVWNMTTHERLELATSRLPDGTYLQAQEVFPVVGHGFVAWSQPTSQTSVDLRVYRFDTRSIVILDSGKLSSPVISSHYLVWAKFLNGATQPSFRFADVDTLQPGSVPSGLSQPQPITFLAGSGDALVWTANPEGTSTTYSMGVYWLSGGGIHAYTSSSLALQFPFLAGDYMVWSDATTSAVLDLHTGSAFEIDVNGYLAASGNTIVVASHAPGLKGAATSTSLSVLHPSALSRPGTCSA